MRTRIWVTLLLVLVPAVAAAQVRQGVGRRPGQRLAPQLMQRGAGAGVEGGPAQMLLDRREELGLTDEQVSRLEALAGEWTAAHQQMRTEMEQLREARTQLNEAQREQLRAVRENAQAAGQRARQGIDEVLTDDQRQKLQDRAGLMRGIRGRAAIRRGGRGGGGAAPGPRGQLGLGFQAQRGPLGLGFQAQRGPLGPAWQAPAAGPMRQGLLRQTPMLQRRAIAPAPLFRRGWMAP